MLGVTVFGSQGSNVNLVENVDNMFKDENVQILLHFQRKFCRWAKLFLSITSLTLAAIVTFLF